MKTNDIPKGVKFSFLMMSFPLLCTTTYLGILAPMLGTPAMVDPANFAYLARTCLRLLALNISFMVSLSYSHSLIGWHSLWLCICDLWDSCKWGRTASNSLPDDIQLCTSGNELLLHIIPSVLFAIDTSYRHVFFHRAHAHSTAHLISWSQVCGEGTGS